MPKRAKDTRHKSPGQGAEPYPYKYRPALPGQVPLVPDLGPVSPPPDIKPAESPPEVTAPEDEPRELQPNLFD